MARKALVQKEVLEPRLPSPRRAAACAGAATIAGLWLASAAPLGASEPNDILPEAPAKTLVVRACVSCHPAPQIVAKRLSADEWDAMLAKMVDRGAQLSDQEQDEVYAYLVKYFGAESRPPG